MRLPVVGRLVARLHAATSPRALAFGALAALCVSAPGSAQPVLPPSTVSYVAMAARSSDAPGASPTVLARDTLPDPYPGTRREEQIHRVPEFTADVIGWVALGRVVWSSGYDQVLQSPKSWPRSAESYGRRFATRSAQLVTIELVRHGVAAALDRDPAYVRCACTGWGPRFAHVAKAVVTDFDEAGVRRIGWPRFAGALAGSIALGQLQPGQGRAGTIAYRAATTVAGSMLGNAVKEIGLFGTGTSKPAREP